MKKYILFFIIAFSLIFFVLNIQFLNKKEPIIDNTVDEIINEKEDKIIDNSNKDIITYTKDDDKEILYLMGKFNPSRENNFSLISKKYTLKDNLYMRDEVYKAFIEMRDGALKDNIKLNIVSATRNFNSQKNIWENKWQGVTLIDNKNLKENIPNELERIKKIIKFSSVPGTSRHHWGSDIDINSVEPSYFNTDKGKKEYEWLSKNAIAFGFCQPYNKDRNSGYEEEKWHWSYMPISKGLLQDYIKLIKLEDIKGFLGDKYVTQMEIINNYVLSINPECI